MRDEENLDPKKKKLKARKARDLRMLIAEKQLAKSAESLKKTSGNAGHMDPEEGGIDEDLGSKVGAKIQSLRSGLHVNREKARRKAKKIFRGR